MTNCNDENEENAINIECLTKTYLIYEKPSDRLKQFLFRGRKRFYKEHPALKGISLEIKRGETVGLVGRNGSGKSTLLQIIVGTLPQTSGNCKVNGRISALLELGAGFNPEFTGRENIYMNAAILGLSKAETDSKFDSIVEFSGIKNFIDRPVKTYSSGMYIRLAFSVAVATDPEILIVDEALAVGDEAFQKKCFDKIQSLKDSGTTILFVSHSAGAIVEICDRAVLMDSGEILMIDSPKKVIANYHKMIFAPQDKISEIRDQILGNSSGGNSLQNSEFESLEEDEASYDKNLLPETTVTYESNGAIISNPRIVDMKDRQVNLLDRRGKYKVKFDVQFNKHSESVLFGMLIKSMSGIEIAGSTSATRQNAVTIAEAGSRAEVEFTFDCLLMAGTYFINCGCSGLIAGERKFLHRIIDGLMFRVNPEPEILVGGIADLYIEAKINMC